MNTLIIFIPESDMKCSQRYLTTFEVSDTQKLWPPLECSSLIFLTQMYYLFQDLDNEADEIFCASVWMFYLFNWDIVLMFSHSAFHPYLPTYLTCLLHSCSSTILVIEINVPCSCTSNIWSVLVNKLIKLLSCTLCQVHHGFWCRTGLLFTYCFFIPSKMKCALGSQHG